MKEYGNNTDKIAKEVLLKILDDSEATSGQLADMYLYPSTTKPAHSSLEVTEEVDESEIEPSIKLPEDVDNSTVIPVYDLDCPEEPLRLV